MVRRNRREEYALFRGWLVDRIKDTQWVVFNDEELEDEARRLGVQPDVLIDAQKQLDADREKAALPKTRIGMPRFSHGQVFDVVVPQQMKIDFEERARSRGLATNCLARSIIHWMLLGSWVPSYYGSSCMYGGEVVKMTVSPKNKWPWCIRTKITRGAATALKKRADFLKTSGRSLVRGAFIDYLDYRIDVPVVPTIKLMFSDPDKYWRLG